ncbi:hypothetical protein [Gemmatimonas sp.]|uniref:hypothetical protein n=1 Tax=Gemmatimonas sp. TaxID=1962908 RepID=UPI0035699305
MTRYIDSAPLPERMHAYARYARSVVSAAASIEANMSGPLPQAFIDRARGYAP